MESEIEGREQEAKKAGKERRDGRKRWKKDEIIRRKVRSKRRKSKGHDMR